jgi:hypothetical protein
MNTKAKKEENQGLVVVKGEAEALIAQAIERHVPVETMEKLLSMRRELKQERAKEEYDRAMAAFQADCPTIAKTKEVKIRTGIVAYRYAPIESIVEQVRDILKKHGFSYSTNMELLGNGVKVSVKVTHAAGHSEITEMSVPLGNKTDIMSQSQVVAAAQTFAKRYAFCNAFGILTGDEDTDGASISSDNHKHGEINGQGRITQKQIGFIKGLLVKKGHSEEELFLKYEVTDISQLTRTQASTIIENLQKLPDSEDADKEVKELAIAV